MLFFVITSYFSILGRFAHFPDNFIQNNEKCLNGANLDQIGGFMIFDGFENYFSILGVGSSYLILHSFLSGDDWMIVKMSGYFSLEHRHPGCEEFHHQTSFGAFADCLLEIASHDEYVCRKRGLVFSEGDSLFSRLLLQFDKICWPNI